MGNNNKLLGTVNNDIECISWDPYYDYLLSVLDDDGYVLCYDVRMLGHEKKKKKKKKLNYDDVTIWNFCAARDNMGGGITDFSYNSNIPGMLATSSIDHIITIYDIQNYKNSEQQKQKQKTPISFYKDMNVGKLFTLNFYNEWLLGCGGSNNDIALWNFDTDDDIYNHFKSRCNNNNSMNDNIMENKMMDDENVCFLDKKEQNVVVEKKKKKDKKKNKRKVHKA